MCAPFFAHCVQCGRNVPVVVEAWPRPDMFEVACGYCCERFEVPAADDAAGSKSEKSS